MKNLMNVALVLFTLALLSSTMFGQVRLLDGTGNPDAPKVNFIDVDGDGICDNVGTDLQGLGSKGLNKGTGVGDGSGVRPQDGTGFGKMNGGGLCLDGTSTLQKVSGRRQSK